MVVFPPHIVELQNQPFFELAHPDTTPLEVFEEEGPAWDASEFRVLSTAHRALLDILGTEHEIAVALADERFPIVPCKHRIAFTRLAPVPIYIKMYFHWRTRKVYIARGVMKNWIRIASGLVAEVRHGLQWDRSPRFPALPNERATQRARYEVEAHSEQLEFNNLWVASLRKDPSSFNELCIQMLLSINAELLPYIAANRQLA